MKLLFAASPLTGHVNPILAVARAAAARGDDVVVTTSEAFGPKVEAAGVRFAPVLSDGDAEFRDVDLPSGPERYRREFEKRFIDAMPLQAQTLKALIAAEKPDAILAGSLFLGALPLLLDDAPRPPIVGLNVSFLFHDRPDGAPLGPGLPPARTPEDAERYAAFKLQSDALFVTPVRAYADARLAEMGLPGLPASLTQSMIVAPDLFAQMTVPGFEYDYGELPETVRFVGALPPPALDGPLPDWWPELDGPRRVVLVTQGTLANHDFGELIEPTLEALAGRDDLLVIATTGGRPLDALKKPLPANARVATFLPFAALLPKIDLLVTNGGYGSVSQALAAGAPIVSAGLTEDKGEVGARIAFAGVGINLAVNAPTVEALRGAIGAALEDPRYGLRAAELAQDFARHDAAAEILAAIDSVVARGASR